MACDLEKGYTMPTLRSWMMAGLFLLVGLVTGTAQAQQIDVIPPSDRLVTDRADLLSRAEERLLEQKLRGYADTTSTQVVVVTIPSLDGVPASMYATELGREWGVGQQGQDNGVVILVSEGDREVFIATGYGLEGAIPDAIASRIVRNIIQPEFRQGRFYAGLSQATDALIDAARGEFQAEESPASHRDDRSFDLATGFVLLIILVFVVNGLRRGGRHGGNGGKRARRGRHGGPFIIWGGGGYGGHRGGHGGFGGGGGGSFGGFGGGSFGGGGAGGSW